MPEVNISKDWCMNMAKLEDGQEIGAGSLDHPLRSLPDPGPVEARARVVAAAVALEHHQFHQQSVWSDGMLRSAARLIAEALKDHPGDDEVGGTGAF